MTYSVKEIFLTLQGEGGQAGKAAVFCRFAAHACAQTDLSRRHIASSSAHSS